MVCPACLAPLPASARFCPQCGASVAADAPADASTPASHAGGGERRHVTVLFCDLAGSTTLAERLDPEDYRAIIRSYQETCAAAVERFDGHTAQYLGDGILALFGWPAAHEDDAQRAALAALAIVEDIRQLNTDLQAERGMRLSVRIGIHSGPVVVGDTSGDSFAGQVVGHALNVAARLQDAAPLDGIVVSRDTLRLLRGRFETEDLGGLQVKGLADPVPAHRLRGRAAGADAAPTWGTTLVGRDAELAVLLAAWAEVSSGTGRTALISGDAGIGKSRLVEALRARIGGERHVWLRIQGSPYHVHSAFHAVAELTQRQLGLQADDPPERRLAALQRLLDESGRAGSRHLLPTLGGLLGVSATDGPAARDSGGEVQRREIILTLADWLMSRAAHFPAVILVEDMHWLDPSTLDLLAVVAERAATARILLVVTFRPGADPAWSDRDSVLHVALQPLTTDQATAIVVELAGQRALPPRIVRELVTRADGMPLFVEELTKAVLESGDRGRGTGSSSRRSRRQVAIPATIQESLSARLDRLGSAKDIAQLASVIGREFPLELLGAVADVEPAVLERELDRLIAAGLLHRRGLSEPRYVFKHALIRDAAYDSLLRGRRQTIHARVGQVLAARPSYAEHQPELVGWHHEQAGAFDAAVTWYEAALANATVRSAYTEAVTHGRRALDVLTRLPPGPARDERELTVRVALGPTLIALHGYGAQEVEDTYQRAHALSGARGDVTHLVETTWGLANYYQARAQLDIAKQLGERLVASTDARDDLRAQVWAHLQLGATHFWRGEYGGALDHLERAVARYDPGGSWFLPGAPDPWVAAQAYRGLVLWTLGRPDAGLLACRDAVSRVRDGTHPFSLGLALCFLATVHQERREAEEVAATADEIVTLALEHGFPNWLGWGRILAGWAHAHLGHDARALEQIQEGLESQGRAGTILGVPAVLLQVAQIHLAAGRVDDASSTIAAGLAFAADTGQHAWDGELQRLAGEIALAAGRTDEAANAFLDALAKARQAGAHAYELRAAMALLRVERGTGNGRAAAERLAMLLQRFDEGGTTKDHVEGHALLRAST